MVKSQCHRGTWADADDECGRGGGWDEKCFCVERHGFSASQSAILDWICDGGAEGVGRAWEGTWPAEGNFQQGGDCGGRSAVMSIPSAQLHKISGAFFFRFCHKPHKVQDDDRRYKKWVFISYISMCLKKLLLEGYPFPQAVSFISSHSALWLLWILKSPKTFRQSRSTVNIIHPLDFSFSSRSLAPL